MSHTRPFITAFAVLLTLWCLGEFVLLRWRRAKARAAPEDAVFVQRAKLGLPLVSLLAFAGWRYVPAARFATDETALVGFLLLALGLALRWWSILLLGRFFTIDVAVADDHRVIDTGPYRVIRHPSYTGIILGAAGFALCSGSYISASVIMIAVVLALMARIRIEERVLSAQLGDAYRQYMSRTKRLIPGIY